MRCKPDLVALGGVTSYSTPYVSASAAILVQAAARGDGGANTYASTNLRTVKALLLNGAVKPSDWTNGPSTPLDARYGAGILNVFNSWKQLTRGQHSFIESTTNASGGAHPPGTNTASEPVLVGWDFNYITNKLVSGTTYADRVNHYYFDLSSGAGSNFTLTATLAWNRQANQSAINDLNLYLYNAANSNLVTCSTSAVDNVEHIFLPSLPAGRYDLQVQKNASSRVTVNETYALAYEFFNLRLGIKITNHTAVLSWPISPAGFALEMTTNLAPPISWSVLATNFSGTTNQNFISVPLTNSHQFFRLQRP